MRRALVAAPGHVAAAANLGVFLRLIGDAEGGEALLRDVLARNPAAANSSSAASSRSRASRAKPTM